MSFEKDLSHFLNDRLVKNLSMQLSVHFSINETEVRNFVSAWMKGESLPKKRSLTQDISGKKETNSQKRVREVKDAVAEVLKPSNEIRDLEKELENLDSEEEVEQSKTTLSKEVLAQIKKAQKEEKYYCVETKRIIAKNRAMEAKYAFYSDLGIAGVPRSKSLEETLHGLGASDAKYDSNENIVEPDEPEIMEESRKSKKTKASKEETKSKKTKASKDVSDEEPKTKSKAKSKKTKDVSDETKSNTKSKKTKASKDVSDEEPKTKSKAKKSVSKEETKTKAKKSAKSK